MSARLYAPTSREVNSFKARLTSPPEFTISFASSRTMTSLSDVVMKAQPFLLSSSRISSAMLKDSQAQEKIRRHRRCSRAADDPALLARAKVGDLRHGLVDGHRQCLFAQE